MYNRSDSLYWALLCTLVSSYRYELLYISDEKDEAWLQSPKESMLVRVKRKDMDWSSSVRRDLEHTHHVADRIGKRGYRAKTVYNIYISKWEPVDDWHDVIEEARAFTPVRTVWFTEQNEPAQADFLKTVLHVGEDGARAIFDMREQEPEVLRYRFSQLLAEQKRQREHVLNYAQPIMTKILVIIQVLMFAVLELFGGSTNTRTLIEFGAKFNPLIIQGEWWRFFTPIFLHIGLLHLLMNTVALYYIGTQVERILGNVRFLIVYLFAGFSGCVLSFVASESVSAGASGAIFGCFGALMYIVLTYSNIFPKTVLQSVLTLIGINLLFGFVVPGIDNAGHIGGLIGGILATVVVHVPKQPGSLLKRTGAFLVVVVLVSGLLLYGFTVQTGMAGLFHL